MSILSDSLFPVTIVHYLKNISVVLFLMYFNSIEIKKEKNSNIYKSYVCRWFLNFTTGTDNSDYIFKYK